MDDDADTVAVFRALSAPSPVVVGRSSAAGEERNSLSSGRKSVVSSSSVTLSATEAEVFLLLDCFERVCRIPALL